MKKKDGALLGAAAALGLLAGVLSGGETLKGLGEALMALGTGLRGLSLTGGWRGALSWVIYVVLGLVPLAGLMPVRRRHTAADALWFVSSAYAFFMLYALVNPFILKDVIAPGARCWRCRSPRRWSCCCWRASACASPAKRNGKLCCCGALSGCSR